MFGPSSPALGSSVDSRKRVPWSGVSEGTNTYPPEQRNIKINFRLKIVRGVF